MARMFRLLRADEIECRINQINEKGLSLLLYKDARCDQNILDETVGAMNWQKSYSRENANCTVSIWDDDKKMWISKEDTGSESKTDAEKGLASDSFKRACFSWGIGRELYTAPVIWVEPCYCEIKKDGARFICRDRFFVKDIAYQDERISGIAISKKGKKGDVFTYGILKNAKSKGGEEQLQKKPSPQKEVSGDDIITAKHVTALQAYLDEHGLSAEKLCAAYQIDDLSQLNYRRHNAIINPANLNGLKVSFGK